MNNKIQKTLIATGLLATLCVTSLSTALAVQTNTEHSPVKGAFKNNAYIVQLVENPVVSYKGTINGYAATKPQPGQKIDPNGSTVVNYLNYLISRQDAVLNNVGGGKKLYSYGYAFNGFAAELTETQAEKLSLTPGVLAVTKDEFRELDTSTTPSFLNLSGSTGVWTTDGVKGENVIIGIVDGGIWPEHPSFSDRTDTKDGTKKNAKLSYQQIPLWHGACVPGEEFTAANCNQKLIGARFYNAGWGGNAGIDQYFPWEFNSPRDFGGHGTHTASTSGGNEGVAITGPTALFGSINGIAPRARIAAYKVCWETGSGGSCTTSDSVAAIDQAVADGVDVINFSISGSQTNFRDPVEIAFLYAADAGVFVAASAGNSGPSASTVAHPGPWLTTVAAGTHNRGTQGSATLGSGETFVGASVATAVGPAPVVYARDVGLAGVNSEFVKLCYSTADTGGAAVLDPDKVKGKIIICDRGVTARVNKSLAVKEAGGVGMILVNTSPSSLNGDFHAVPSVHLPDTDRAAVLAYADIAGATATINNAIITLSAPAPYTASFSSRGPLKAGDGDLLKPDIIAPGQDILAGVAPPGNQGKLFDLYSGTSMSSPHVAGLAALLKQKNPSWSPMMIKSALMTSASDVLDGPNTNPLVIFRQGAGHVSPPSAMNPGLVFDSGFSDWINFICGVQPGDFCSGFTPIDPSNLNVASISIGNLAGTQTVTRTVTNVGDGPATYSASVSGMSGFSVAIEPSSFTIGKGETQTFSVTTLRNGAPLNGYTGGQLTLTDGTHKVRIPMVVRPVALAAPQQVSGSYEVSFGYDGTFSTTARGLVAPAVTAGTVSQDPDQSFSPADPVGVVAIPVTIPAGTSYMRFSLFDEDVAPGGDLDLYVYQGYSLVGSSTNNASAEQWSYAFPNPTPGNIALTVYVHGYSLSAGATPFRLYSWVLGTQSAGNIVVSAPDTATMGTKATINLSFSDLTPSTKYLGSVVYGGTSMLPSPTIVRVDTP